MRYDEAVNIYARRKFDERMESDGFYRRQGYTFDDARDARILTSWDRGLNTGHTYEPATFSFVVEAPVIGRTGPTLVAVFGGEGEDVERDDLFAVVMRDLLEIATGDHSQHVH